MSVIDGVVHVNKTKAYHGTVTTFHFFAEIGEKAAEKVTCALNKLYCLLLVMFLFVDV